MSGIISGSLLKSSITSSLGNSNQSIQSKIKELHNEYGSKSITTASNAVKRVFRTEGIEEVLFDARAKVKILTSSVSMHLELQKIRNLYHQIDLIHDADDWDLDDKAVNPESYKSFLKWLILASPERNPGIGLSSVGNIIGVWMDGPDRLILEFSPNDKVKWVVKRTHPDPELGSGETKILRLQEILAPYSPDTFFSKKD